MTTTNKRFRASVHTGAIKLIAASVFIGCGESAAPIQEYGQVSSAIKTQLGTWTDWSREVQITAWVCDWTLAAPRAD